jgi:hypothetical protein
MTACLEEAKAVIKPRVLILIDRLPGEPLATEGSFGLSFSPTPDPTDRFFFSLSHLVAVLQADVTKAHRQTDPASDNGSPTPANIENFRFSVNSLDGFDQVWLIGYNDTRPDSPKLSAPQRASVLDASEHAVLTAFMNQGGGVYAVGDHAGLGLSLSGGVPRVRSMRKWWYPTAGPRNEPVAPPGINLDNDRLDSTRSGHTAAGPQAVWFDDQSDDIPQYLQANSRSDVCYDPLIYELNPALLHPLLQGPKGPILAFADHMHEGEVVLPDEYDRIFSFAGQKFVEYPSGPSGVVKPQIVAWSFTNGSANIVPPGETEVHVGDPRISRFRQFGAIGAYDGSIARVGRVVVESTFHHFIDINLIGDPMAPTGDPKQQGFRTSDGQAILANIEAYYNNILHWLSPLKVRSAQWAAGPSFALRNRTLREIATNPPADVRDRLGELTVAALRQQVRPGILIDRLTSVLPDAVRMALPAFPWGPISGTVGCGSVDYHQLLHAALGEAVLVAGELSQGRGSVALLDDPEAHRRIIEGSVRGVASVADELARRGAGLVRLANALKSGQGEASRQLRSPRTRDR